MGQLVRSAISPSGLAVHPEQNGRRGHLALRASQLQRLYAESGTQLSRLHEGDVLAEVMADFVAMCVTGPYFLYSLLFTTLSQLHLPPDSPGGASRVVRNPVQVHPLVRVAALLRVARELWRLPEEAQAELRLEAWSFNLLYRPERRPELDHLVGDADVVLSGTPRRDETFGYVSRMKCGPGQGAPGTFAERASRVRRELWTRMARGDAARAEMLATRIHFQVAATSGSHDLESRLEFATPEEVELEALVLEASLRLYSTLVREVARAAGAYSVRTSVNLPSRPIESAGGALDPGSVGGV